MALMPKALASNLELFEIMNVLIILPTLSNETKCQK